MQFYVYALIDPRNGKPFYIGKGKGDRISAHEKEARKGAYSRKCARIREIWNDGHQVIRLVLSRHDDEVEAYEAEAEEVSRIGLDNLTNVLPGGGGVYPVRARSEYGSVNLTDAQLRRLAPKMAKFCKVMSDGGRFMVCGHDVTPSLTAFFRDVIKGTGETRIKAEMERQGIFA